MRRFFGRRFAISTNTIAPKKSPPSVVISSSITAIRSFSTGNDNNGSTAVPIEQINESPTRAIAASIQEMPAEVNSLICYLQDAFNTATDKQKLMLQLEQEICKISEIMTGPVDDYFRGQCVGPNSQQHKCIVRKIAHDPAFAIIFKYHTTEDYMAVIRAKKEYFLEAIAGQSKLAFVKDYKLLFTREDEGESYYLCSLQVGDPIKCRDSED